MVRRARLAMRTGLPATAASLAAAPTTLTGPPVTETALVMDVIDPLIVIGSAILTLPETLTTPLMVTGSAIVTVPDTLVTTVLMMLVMEPLMVIGSAMLTFPETFTTPLIVTGSTIVTDPETFTGNAVPVALINVIPWLEVLIALS